jgi:hypothetical protein
LRIGSRACVYIVVCYKEAKGVIEFNEQG